MLRSDSSTGLASRWLDSSREEGLLSIVAVCYTYQRRAPSTLLTQLGSNPLDKTVDDLPLVSLVLAVAVGWLCLPQVGFLFVQMPGCNLARYGDLESITRAELILILLTYGGMCDLA
ncbi:hypothetical protein V3481_003820 [Fusarium oxysporum f. sp. vasinfectum]